MENKKIAIVAPSNSMSYIHNDLVNIGIKRLTQELQMTVFFGEHVNNEFLFAADSPENRVKDIHQALYDYDTALIMAAYGGYNTNDILPFLNFDLILERKVRFLGYSDITVLLNAIYTKTGLSSLLGPSFTTFCDPNIFNESFYYLKQILDNKTNIFLSSSKYCADDNWFLKNDYGPRDIYPNQGWKIFQEGSVTAKLVGGNLESFLTLFGTQYFPDCTNHILVIEANANEPPGRFIRDMIHLKQIGIFDKICGVIIGQFNNESCLSKKVMDNVLGYIFKEYSYPIIYNTNFSHVDPLLPLPIGGNIKLIAHDIPSIILYPH